MQDRPLIQPETLKLLMSTVSDPNRLGGYTRAFGLISRKYGEAFKAKHGLEINTFQDLEVLFSSMLEEEAAAFLLDYNARMPDLRKNTIAAVIARLPDAR